MKHTFVTILLVSMLGNTLLGKRSSFLVPIPKCGTHMTVQILEAMGSYAHRVEGVFFNVNLGILEAALQAGIDIWSHALPNPHIFKLLQKYNYAVLFVYRDPRAYLASLAHHIKSKSNYYTHARSYTIQEVIADLMHEGNCQKNSSADPWFPSKRGIVNVFNSYAGWLSAPNVLTIRYEELVGPSGGGTIELQRESIKKIAQHLELELAEEQLRQVANALLVNRHHEFRQGTIDSWKDDFTPQLLEEFYNLNDPLLLRWCWEDKKRQQSTNQRSIYMKRYQ